ncbi:hypothetical protein GW17_00005107 [Ensete ventricosum]|nr:hypothetical protein GW17_00005107 [Ensete ventricosum]
MSATCCTHRLLELTTLFEGSGIGKSFFRKPENEKGKRRRADLNPKVNSIRMLAFCMGSLFHVDGFLFNLIPLFNVCISEKAPPVQRKPLKHRDYEVDLESRLGKTQVCCYSNSTTKPADGEDVVSHYQGLTYRSILVYRHIVGTGTGWYTQSESFGHVYAGGKGDSSTGMTLFSVQERFEVLKKRKAPEGFTEQDLDERIRKQQEEEEERKRLRREKKKEKKVSSSCAKEKAAQEEVDDVDPDVAAMMGFGGFRSSKK